MAAIRVPLNGSLARDLGLYAVIDDRDLALLSGHSWRAVRPDPSVETVYAVTRMVRDGAWRTTYMHRIILAAQRGVQVDHIDHDGLNNTRGNLRICSQSLNNANARQAVGASGFRGVYFDKRRARPFAAISVRGEFRWLGAFPTAIEAARAYDDAAREAFGEFATLNFTGGA